MTLTRGGDIYDLLQDQADFNQNSSFQAFWATDVHRSVHLKSDMLIILGSITPLTVFAANSLWSCDAVVISMFRDNKRLLFDFEGQSD